MHEPYRLKAGSKEAGQCWTAIANKINSYDVFKSMPRDQRSVRDRFHKLLSDFKGKMAEEEKASGISPRPLTETETLIEEVVEAMKCTDAPATEGVGDACAKVESERKKAMDIRAQAMTTWRKKTADSESDNSDTSEVSPKKPKRKRQRRSGSEALRYLELKSDKEQQLKEEEMKLKREEMELEKQRQEQGQTQMKAQMQQLNEQAAKQQEQFTFLQQQIQQQMHMQSTLMMAMLEKFSGNKS